MQTGEERREPGAEQEHRPWNVCKGGPAEPCGRDDGEGAANVERGAPVWCPGPGEAGLQREEPQMLASKSWLRTSGPLERARGRAEQE